MSKEPTIQEMFLAADNFRNNAQVDKAVSAYVYISEVAKEQGDMPSIARALHMAGVSLKEDVLGEGSRLRDAIDYFKQAERVYSKTEDKVGLGALYRDCGIILDYAGRFEEAEPWLKKSIEILEQTDAIEHLGISTDKLGLHYLKSGKVDEAEKEIVKGIELLKQKPEAGFFYATALYDLSRVLFKQKRYEDAKSAAEESLSWFEADHDQEQYGRRKAQLYGILSLIYDKVGDDKKARQAGDDYEDLSGKLDSEAEKVLEKDLEELTKD